MGLLQDLKMTNKSIWQLLRTPVFLQLFVLLPEERRRSFKNTTELYECLFERFFLSQHTSGLNFEEDTMKKLRALSFEKCREGKVLISGADFKRHEINLSEIKKVCVVAINPEVKNTYLLLPSEINYFLVHQTLQEFYASEYVLKHLSKVDFDDFVKNELFPAVELDTRDRLATVRRFVLGQLKMTSTGVDADETTRRRFVLLQVLYERMKELFTREKEFGANHSYQLNLMTTCNEIQQCVAIHVKIAMKNHQFWLRCHGTEEEEMDAYTEFIKETVSKFECLLVTFHDDNEDAQADFIEAALYVEEVRKVVIDVSHDISERTRDAIVLLAERTTEVFEMFIIPDNTRDLLLPQLRSLACDNSGWKFKDVDLDEHWIKESKYFGYSPDTSFHTSSLDSLKDFYFV